VHVIGIETTFGEMTIAILEAPAEPRPVGRILTNVAYSQFRSVA
jgi:tRNA A37 threonylcarbamoyltransferase TsaD